jgi:hypothetical protein
MPKVQNGWSLAPQLMAALKGSRLTHKQLAIQAGVQYYAVRRMRLDGVRNRSANALALCKFFGISEPAVEPALSAADLTAAVRQAWDGTEDQGRLILDLVRCVGQFKVAPKP